MVRNFVSKVLLLCAAALVCATGAMAQGIIKPTTWGGIKATVGGEEDSPEGAPMLIPGSHNWSSYVQSEAFYSLSRSRSGYSSLYYQGYAMSDWDYPHSDNAALNKITGYIGSGNVGSLGKWLGTYQQGGFCKFFANLILYRSSYGYGEGWHLVVPRGYTYATRSTREAGVGWVLQSPSSRPHTAVVVAVFSNGLDVIDANWVGTYGTSYSYAIGRHLMTWSTLDSWGFRAYCPWTDGYANNNQGFLHE